MSRFSINPKKFLINDDNDSNSSRQRFQNIQESNDFKNPNILGNIIRSVNPTNVLIDEENEKLIIIDDRTGKIQNQDNFMIRARTFMGRSYSHYVVNWTEFSNVDSLSCKISNPKDGTTIELDMSFEISFVEKREEDILRFFKNNISSSRVPLEKAIANWSRSFISHNPDFIDNFFELESDLKDFITRQASRNIGVLIQNIHFKPIGESTEDFPPQHLTIVHATNCQILDDHLEVKNKIVVNLINRRAFLWRRIDNPEAWIKQKINTIIQNQLIKKSFRQIVNEFNPTFREIISQELEEAVREIGYSVEHIISVPSNEIAEFLDMFTFNLEENDTFETSAAEIKVRLSVTVEAKGTELSEVDDKYIKPRKSIIEEVRKQTIQIVGTTLRQTNPADYYSDFNRVSESLEAAIRESLFQNFKLDNDNFRISISFLNTDLKQRFDRLFAERGIIRVESNNKNVSYEVKFGVKGVNDWYVFHKNHIKYEGKTALEYQDIGDYLKSQIELEVRKISGVDIVNIDIGMLDQAIKNLFFKAQSVIKREFGLELGSPQLSRSFGGDILSTKGIIASANKEHVKLLQEQLTYAIKSGDHDMVKEIKQELEEMTKEIVNISTENRPLLMDDNSHETKRIDNPEDDEK